MATHAGSEGTVKVGANAIAEIRSFSVEETGDTIDDSTMGDSARTYIAGLKTYTQVLETKDGRRIRVRVGPFAGKSEADKAAEKIKKLNLPAATLSL